MNDDISHLDFSEMCMKDQHARADWLVCPPCNHNIFAMCDPHLTQLLAHASFQTIQCPVCGIIFHQKDLVKREA